MNERSVVLASASGLHARPAAIFVQEAKRFRSQIVVSRGEKTVNAKSILSVLTLGAEQGDRITLRAEGDDAAAAVDALATLLERDLG